MNVNAFSGSRLTFAAGHLGQRNGSTAANLQGLESGGPPAGDVGDAPPPPEDEFEHKMDDTADEYIEDFGVGAWWSLMLDPVHTWTYHGKDDNGDAILTKKRG